MGLGDKPTIERMQDSAGQCISEKEVQEQSVCKIGLLKVGEGL